MEKETLKVISFWKTIFDPCRPHIFFSAVRGLQNSFKRHFAQITRRKMTNLEALQLVSILFRFVFAQFRYALAQPM